MRHIDDLHAVIKKVKDAYPFVILAMVVLPEHLHAIWRLPPGDADYPLCWSLIKAGFLRWLAKGEHIRASRRAEVKCWASFHLHFIQPNLPRLTTKKAPVAWCLIQNHMNL
ncbi:MAG: hypothetical protein WAT12_09895 [Candidatus Nitrotoga sp.]